MVKLRKKHQSKERKYSVNKQNKGLKTQRKTMEENAGQFGYMQKVSNKN
jgi:hypothetical protein